MRLKLFLLLLLAAIFPSLAQSTSTITGVVVNSNSGSPVSGAVVVLRDLGVTATTNFNGGFRLTADATGKAEYLVVSCDAYESHAENVVLRQGTINLGEIRLSPVDSNIEFYGDQDDLIFDETALEDEESSGQSVAALTGANDNIYYNTASYNFGPMYFRFRGYDSMYQSVYINGVQFNDLVRGRFSFSSLLGMTSRAFRNKTTNIGIDAANYGFGDLGGSVNYNTVTDLYAPGFNGSLAFTNSNYMMRAMATYSTGLNRNGWAFTVSAIGRYAKEGVMKGTFYNSGGVFLSIEKVFNPNHSLTLTAFGGPTQRATGRATYQEAYDLAGTNLYNPDWGWQDGKKRSSRITETWDPTAMLTWLFKKGSTTVNTTVAFQYNHYNRTALQFYKALDPKPDYYRYLPSNFYNDNGEPTEESELYTELWKSGQLGQINWDRMYEINELNNYENLSLPESQKKGSSYIVENRINNTLNLKLNSYINTTINRNMTLQGGVSAQYSNQSNYKTVRDLLGGEFWLDIDPFSDREIAIAPDNLINDLDNPYRRVKKGDKFGYDYNFHVFRAEGWLQNVITLPHWDINYGFKVSYTQFYRDGHMRNGRAPLNSKGKSKTLTFDNGVFKAGVTYKLDGRNQFVAHAEYGSRAPLVDNVFIASRVKNTTVENPESERNFSGDLSYVWNYRRFRGSVTGYYTQTDNAIERHGFYDDDYNTYTNYVLSNVRKVYKGIEVGMAFKITPSLTATFAGTYAQFQYKNNPNGTRTFENGLYPDTTQVVYLKNFHLGSTPQYAANLGFDYAAPHNWFFNINATLEGNSYVNLSPRYHESLSGLPGQIVTLQQNWLDRNPGATWTDLPSDADLINAKIAELSAQEKLKNAFTLNLSIGKLIYINRKVSLNVNLSINNILNNRNIVTNAYQQGRLDLTDYNINKYPNKYSYAQGIRAFLNVGVRF